MKSSYLRRVSDSASGASTLISEDCIVEGNLRGSGEFTICGEVRGDCYLTGNVTIVEGGKWLGKLSAKNVIVAGTVDGDIVANGQIEICETARISGTVTGVAIAVGQGAIIDGAIRTIQADDPLEFVEQRAVDEQAVNTG